MLSISNFFVNVSVRGESQAGWDRGREGEGGIKGERFTKWYRYGTINLICKVESTVHALCVVHNDDMDRGYQVIQPGVGL